MRIQQQAELHEELSRKGKSKVVMKGRQVVDVDESDDTDYEDLSPNEKEWREGLQQSRRVAMLESEMRRYHSTREGSSSGASVTRPPAPPMDRFKLKLDIYRDYDLREAVNRMSLGENLEA
ncbi:hypothetical protein Taro_005394 [Colocasia esculenta]|uniref:Uncharacterized protein n=1 Tax=Colocasia esculenta TaxID=4460 RepID=A0A843TXR6_COLES|nr:hypothetical protein [Colocasia esculenta]